MTLRRLIRVAIVLVLRLLPGRTRSNAFRMLLGWDVHETARVGWSIVDVRMLRMGRGARIGHLNVLRNMIRVELGDEALVGQWVWVSAAVSALIASPADGSERGVLKVGAHSAVTSRHYVDCSGGVSIGAFTTLAGVRTTILTHQIDVMVNRQTTLPVTIGEYCFVGSDSRIVPGAHIPDRCAIAMGSIVAGRLPECGMLYAGSPARCIKRVDDGAYFHRQIGFVSF